MKIALLTVMSESSPEGSLLPPSSFSETRKWFDLAMDYLPSLLKLLAALGLLKQLAPRMREHRQNLQAIRRAKRAAAFARRK